MPEAPTAPARRSIPADRADREDREIKLWPVFVLFPIVVVGTVKALGVVSIGGIDLTVLSVVVLTITTLFTFLTCPRYPVAQMSPFVLFTLVVLAGVARSDIGEYQTLKSRDFLLTVVVVSCLPILLRSRQDFRGLVVIWLLAGTLAATLVHFVDGSDSLYGRAGVGDATLGPAYLSAVALVVGAAAMGDRLLPVAVALPVIVVSGIALITIGSRGPILGAAAGLVVWTMLRSSQGGGRSLIVLLVVSAVAALGVNQASEAVLSRFVLEDWARQDLWATALATFPQVPLMGLGWGDFTTVSWANYPHNLFLETATELGLLGLLVLCTVLAIACSRIWHNRQAAEVRALAALAIVLVVGQQFSGDLPNRLLWIALIPCLLLPARGVDPYAASPTIAQSALPVDPRSRPLRQQMVVPPPTGTPARPARTSQSWR